MNIKKDTMSNEVLVKVEGISKKFCRSLKRSMLYGVQDIAKDLFHVRRSNDRLREDEFWALDDVSFKLRRGECLGIIGLNGAGKSTILKMLSGIILPDKGTIEINGQVGALIELGAGFHPMLTGRENICINGSILGLTKKEIDAKLNSVVDFAELHEFIDTPVKFYSSGMFVRLGFAIAVHLKPDLMLIDEVLAVGDFAFRQKCAEKINEMRENTTIIFVSHNMRDILMLCSRAIVLDRGKAVFKGTSEEAVDFYLDSIDGVKEAKQEEKVARKTAEIKESRSSLYGEKLHNKEKITEVRYRWIDRSGKTLESVKHGETISLEFSFKLLKPITNPIIGVPIWDSKGNLVTAIGTDAKGHNILIQKDGSVKGRLTIERLLLNPDNYISYLAVTDGKEFLFRDCIGSFRVGGLPVHFGIITPIYNWHFEDGLGFKGYKNISI